MKKALVIFIVLTVAAIGFSAFNYIPSQREYETRVETEIKGLEIGDKAPDFTLKNVDGKMVSLADFKDAKGFVINFTCNTCPFAQMYEERVVALQDKLEKKGVYLINIMPNNAATKPGDSFKNMQAKAKEVGYKYYLIDEDQSVYPQYGATRTPHVFVLDKKKVVRYIGAIDDNAQDPDGVEVNYVENAIKAIQAGKEPDPDFTKAIGCSIKL